MEHVNVREFRNNISQYLQADAPFAVMKHGNTMGYYIPSAPSEREKELSSLHEAAAKFHALLEEKGVDEDEIVREFQELRKSSRTIVEP